MSSRQEPQEWSSQEHPVKEAPKTTIYYKIHQQSICLQKTKQPQLLQIDCLDSSKTWMTGSTTVHKSLNYQELKRD